MRHLSIPFATLATFLFLPFFIQGPVVYAAEKAAAESQIAGEAGHRPLASRTASAIPALLEFQGRLADENGIPLDTTLSMLFQIYEMESGGAPLWSESQSVDIAAGLFRAQLGQSTAIDSSLFSDADRWLGLTVGGDSELSPRTRLVSVPYALVAGEAVNDKDQQTLDLTGNSLSITGGNSVDLSSYTAGDELGNHTATQNLSLNDNWLSNDGNAEGIAINNNGQVGIGTSSPGSRLEVTGVTTLNGNVFITDNNALDVDKRAVIGTIPLGAQSTDQAASLHNSAGFLTTPWLYTNAIEAQAERGGGSTLVTVGEDGVYGVTDEIHLVTGGNDRVAVDAAGRVGIGVNPPLSLLHVAGTSTFEADMDLNGTLAIADSLTIGGDLVVDGTFVVENGGTVGGELAVNGPLLDVAQIAVVGDINAGNASTDQQASTTFAGNGFLTTPWLYTPVIQAPSERGGSPTLIAVGDDGNRSATNEIHLVTNGQDRLVIDSSGKVGIGTSSPDNKLHVDGAVQLDGNTTVNGHFEAYDPSHGINRRYSNVVFSVQGTSTDNDWLFYVENSFENHRFSVDRQGDVFIAGSLAKSGGSFKIDHPLDPANKYLYHSFVESPDMMNIYNGNVVTDSKGYANVTMPDWFESLNRDFRYQLTVVDEEDSESFVQAKVVRKIQGNTFRIRSSEPQAEISWMVTGIRQDNWANENRIPLEVPKTGGERGRYLHPAAFGLGSDYGIRHQDLKTD